MAIGNVTGGSGGSSVGGGKKSGPAAGGDTFLNVLGRRIPIPPIHKPHPPTTPIPTEVVAEATNLNTFLQNHWSISLVDLKAQLPAIAEFGRNTGSLIPEWHLLGGLFHQH